MTPEQFAQAMLVLGETFNEPVSDVRIEAYADALGDLEPGLVLAAMKSCIRESTFFPRPVEIRQRVLGTTEDRIELAWGKLCTAVARVGYTGKPDLDDETFSAIRAVWGTWVKLCETLPNDGPELLGWRKAFAAAYGAQERRNEQLRLEGGVALTSRDQLAPNVRAFIGALTGAKE